MRDSLKFGRLGFPGDSVVKNLPTYAGDGFHPWIGKIPWSRKWLPTPVFLPEKFNGQKSWRVSVHGVAKNQT